MATTTAAAKKKQLIEKGVRVSWTLKNGVAGAGLTVIDEDDSGNVLVAVDPLVDDPVAMKTTGRTLAQSSLEFHPVIYCAASWLSLA